MKNSLIRMLGLPALLLLALVLASCGQKPPAEDVVKKTISDCVLREVPRSWTQTLRVGKEIQVESVEIVQTGNYNEEGKYWPVKAKVKGDCKIGAEPRQETKTFEEAGDFKLQLDDYGAWKAVLKEE